MILIKNYLYILLILCFYIMNCSSQKDIFLYKEEVIKNTLHIFKEIDLYKIPDKITEKEYQKYIKTQIIVRGFNLLYGYFETHKKGKTDKKKVLKIINSIVLNPKIKILDENERSVKVIAWFDIKKLNDYLRIIKNEQL